MTQPENTTLQYGDMNGNITHLGTLGSNTYNSTLLTTFPTTSTGTSLGHYHYTEPTTNALKFLNASGIGQGGHQFWHSSSTQAPAKVLETNRTETKTNTQFVVDKSIQGGTTLVNLPAIIVGQLTQVVFQFPPALDTFGIQFGVYDNPVQVLFNAGVFTTGTTYYAQATNAQTLVIRTTPNPSDPPLDCSVFTYGQIPFAYVSGSTPSSIQTATLSSGLEIATDTTFSAVYNDSLVVQDLTNNRQSLTYAYKSVYQDNAEGVSTTILAPLAIENNQVFNATGNTSSVIIQVDTPTITTTNNTDVSVLSSTDLTFNTVSLQTTLRDLQIKQTSVINQGLSLAIFADGRPALPPSTTVAQQYAYTPSWYFKNTFATNNKINWYILANSGMIVSDILGLYLAFFNGTNTSNDNTPFITVYTTPTGTGDYAPGFFHSSKTYIFDGSITANTRYTEFLNLDNCPTPNYYGTTLRSMISSPVNNPRGQYLPTETVAFFSISTNSSAIINTLEIAVSKFGIMLSSGTTEVNFFA